MTIDFNLVVTAEDKAAAALDEAKATARRDLIAALDAAAAALTGPVPLAEQLSWTTKDAAARAHLAGAPDAAQSAMLAAEAARTGEDVDTLAQAILANATAYRHAAAVMAGLRRKYSAQIQAATMPAQVTEAIVELRSELSQMVR